MEIQIVKKFKQPGGSFPKIDTEIIKKDDYCGREKYQARCQRYNGGWRGCERKGDA